jgi:hypothetical protein
MLSGIETKNKNYSELVHMSRPTALPIMPEHILQVLLLWGSDSLGLFLST